MDDSYVQVVPRSSGKPRRPIRREDFERVEVLGLTEADVTPDQLKGVGIDEYNLSYIAAIIRAAVGQVTPGKASPTRDVAEGEDHAHL